MSAPVFDDPTTPPALDAKRERCIWVDPLDGTSDPCDTMADRWVWIAEHWHPLCLVHVAALDAWAPQEAPHEPTAAVRLRTTAVLTQQRHALDMGLIRREGNATQITPQGMGILVALAAQLGAQMHVENHPQSDLAGKALAMYVDGWEAIA